ncbi:MAG: cell division protein ZapB [Treponema sp.]|nr:cell division protein ZapB [Treponema sp.]
MVTLEQVKLLDTRVTKTVEYIKKLTNENSALKKKLESNRQRIDELELLIGRFKEDQGRIEEGILSALNRLNQFEDAVENMLSADPAPAGARPVTDNNQPDHNQTVKNPAENPGAIKKVIPADKVQAEAKAKPEENPQDEPSPVIELDIF